MTKENTVTEIPKLESLTSENVKVKENIHLESSSERLRFERERYELERKESRRRIYLLLTFTFAFSILIFASISNPGIYTIDKDTLVIINQAFNAIVLLVVPFLLGSLGAIARILMAGAGGSPHNLGLPAS